MFTGIIKKISIIEEAFYKKGGLFISIKIPASWKVREGESISINGICSTIKKTKNKNFTVEYMPETIKKTTAAGFRKGQLINLEKSLQLNNLLDGHLVQGHVDTRGKIVEIKKAKESRVMKIRIPEKFMRFVPEKGSVAVDGISLTVVETGKNWLTVSLVSFTLENTNLGKTQVGDVVNIETDVLAKYIAKLLNC
jgi:riboflavin synthase